MNKEVNEIINSLCTKLGTTSKLLIAEMAKLRIAESIVELMIFLVVLIVGLYFLPKAWKYDHREDKEFYDDSFFTVIPAIVVAIGFIFAMITVYDLVGWLVSPTAKTVLEISSMIAQVGGK